MGKPPATLRDGVKMLTAGHDYMFAFPGEMAPCMVYFWDHCPRHCRVGFSHACGRKHSCFAFSSLSIRKYSDINGGFASFTGGVVAGLHQRKKTRFIPEYNFVANGVAVIGQDGKTYRGRWLHPFNRSVVAEDIYFPFHYHVTLNPEMKYPKRTSRRATSGSED